MRGWVNTLLVVGVVSILSLTTALATDKKKNKEHRHHHAHSHGAGKISMAFDGLKGRIELEITADSILGFEHEAKSDTDKATLAAAIKNFQNDFAKMVQLDAASECLLTADKVEQKIEGKKSKHSDFKASYNVECKKTILNTTIKFNFAQYQNIHDLDVTILVDQLQKNIEVSNKESSILLK